MLKIALAFLMVASFEPTAATTPSPKPSVTPSSEQVAAAEKKADDDRVVCRKELVVGSHRPMKKCLTKAQWREYADQVRNDLDARGQPPRPMECDMQC
jgi:hypothetical protein